MNHIEELRRQKDMSQQQLAEKLGVHQTAVSQWEKERTTPSFKLLNKMSEIFETNPYYVANVYESKDPCTGCIAISRCVVETWRCHACTRNPDLRDHYESEAYNDQTQH